MSMQLITHMFDELRRSDINKLAAFRDRVRHLAKTTDIESDLTEEKFNSFWKDTFFDCGDIVNTKDKHVILDQLRRSLEGNTLDEETETFVACWDHWLRDNPSRKPGLLIVDVQNDFISGSLALKNCPAGEDGYDVLPVINDILHRKLFNHIVYTLDWHPPNHCSFIDNVHLYPVHESSPVTAKEAKAFDTVIYAKPIVMEQRLWPVHCVQNTWGAELHKELKEPGIKDHVAKKGWQPDVDSYSAFWSRGHFYHTDLFKVILSQGITDVYLCGLALDYCVMFTARDAVKHGFKTYVVEDACRSISKEGCCDAKDGFKKDGVILINSVDIEKTLT